MMNNASSFTALLELPPTQVAQLLHDVVLDPHSPQCHTPTHAPPPFDPLASPVEIEAPKPVIKRKKRKTIEEEKDEDEEGEVVRVGGGGSRGKKRKEESQSELPYVHVRARRGQATDSHSLAERARREKINARMKLLQELVPGCSKISGIALVLDEIINHVQVLQRQVMFLSMQLAAVNPRIEFNLDRFMDEENAFVDGRLLSMHPPYEWSDPQDYGLCGFKRSFVQQWQRDTHQQPLWLKEESHLESATIPEITHLRNDSPDTECMLPRQLKVEQT